MSSDVDSTHIQRNSFHELRSVHMWWGAVAARRTTGDDGWRPGVALRALEMIDATTSFPQPKSHMAAPKANLSVNICNPTGR
ncbi:hypothetical protein E5D57_013402 [Metarhizium anisopliae]|nr:hypothetical protein E5D57_013402 [Metarhizium anisopliae]